MTTVVKKIDALPAMADAVANNDKLVMLDVSASAVDMTKLMTMSQIPISQASQLGANVVTSAAIAYGAVTNSKLGADAVNGTKIADDSIDSEHYVDLSIDTAHIADLQVTSAKLAAGAVTAGKIATGGVSASGQVAANILALDRLAQVTGPAVIGRNANTAGNLAAITSGTDGHVLRQSGTSIGFGTITGAGIANDAIDSQHYAADSIDAEHYAPDSVDYLALNKTSGSEAVTTATIRNSAVTPAKTSFAPGTTTTNGVARFSGTTGGIKDTSTFKIGDSGQVTLTTSATPAMCIDGMDSANNTYSLVVRNGSASNNFWIRNDGAAWLKGALNVGGSLTVTGEIVGAKHVVYMQLFQSDEAVVTTSAKTQFFVPAYLAGGVVKQLGIGVVSPSTGVSITVALGSSYGSVSGVTSTETANTLSYTLPSALTKIPINVTVSSGTAPLGLDFWFVVLK